MAKNAREKVALAKQKIAFQWRFLTPKMFDLKFVESELVPRAGTDGVYVYWNPAFIDKLNQSQTMFVIVHEIFHPLRKHHIRFLSMKNWDKDLANVAMDATINNMLVDEMGLEIPKDVNGEIDGVYMPQYRGWTWEAIYKDLEKKAIKVEMWDECFPYPGRGDGEQDGKDKGKGKGDPVPGDEKADSVEERMEDKRIEGQLKEMERIGVKAGKLPGSFKSLVKDMTMTKVPWEQVLARFVDETSDKDYDWMAPDENYINGDIYIPTLHDPKIGKGAIFFDTSASVDEKNDFPKFKGGLYGILSAYDMEVFIAEIDYIVQKTYTITSADLSSLKVEFKGRGGTDFDAGFELIKKDDLQPKFIIYFTDGECHVNPESEPDCPVLWALLKRDYSKHFKPPFGEVLFID